MIIKKADFKSRNIKPIMTAYLGADFDQKKAFKDMDPNKASNIYLKLHPEGDILNYQIKLSNDCLHISNV